MLNSKNNKGIEVTKLFLDTAKLSTETIKEEICGVKYSDVLYSDAYDSITFNFNGLEYIGHLRGRNHGLMLGTDQQNKAIALRAILDGDCEIKV